MDCSRLVISSGVELKRRWGRRDAWPHPADCIAQTQQIVIRFDIWLGYGRTWRWRRRGRLQLRRCFPIKLARLAFETGRFYNINIDNRSHKCRITSPALSSRNVTFSRVNFTERRRRRRRLKMSRIYGQWKTRPQLGHKFVLSQCVPFIRPMKVDFESAFVCLIH